MTYAICEPRKFRVLRRFDDLGIADAWAVAEIRARRYDRLVCIYAHDSAETYTDRKENRAYRWMPAHRKVEVEIISGYIGDMEEAPKPSNPRARNRLFERFKRK